MTIFRAESEGFEPSIPFGIRAFQARALDQLCELSLKRNKYIKYLSFSQFHGID